MNLDDGEDVPLTSFSGSRGSNNQPRVNPMREFFHGWRRKAGVVTLVMALLAVSGWIKSKYVQDVIAVDIADKTHFFVSNESHVFWVTGGGSSVPPPISWTSGRSTRTPNGDYVLRKTVVEVFARSGIRSIPYSCIVLPLTLLAAYLILWKPRKLPKP